MIRLPSRLSSRQVRARAARARRARSAPLWIAAALAGWVGCASNPPPPPPALEVLRTTNEDGSVRYTLRRNRSPEESNAAPDGAAPPDPGTPAGSSGGDERPGSGQTDPSGGPSEQIRDQLETDREFLRQLISRNAPAGFERSQDPQLRQIAERLPRLQAELEALENEPEP